MTNTVKIYEFKDKKEAKEVYKRIQELLSKDGGGAKLPDGIINGLKEKSRSALEYINNPKNV